MILRATPFLAALLLASCTTPTANNPTTLSHEVVIDQKTAFLYTGNADLRGDFPTDSTSKVFLQVSADGEPATNPAAARLIAAFPKALPTNATFFPDGENKGMLSTASGRFEAHGTLNSARTEFTGTWFFDDLEGGTFHIAPKGTIFP